ncbi:MAG: bacteriophage CI repressor [Acidimicrobiaceae bacterium]|nr:bacteriophage CI repressor [Acidimicrobiaceae bacterium]
MRGIQNGHESDDVGALHMAHHASFGMIYQAKAGMVCLTFQLCYLWHMSLFADLQRAIRDRIDRGESARSMARRAGLPLRAVQNIIDGHHPSLDRVEKICDMLELESYIGPARIPVIREMTLRLPPSINDLVPDLLDTFESEPDAKERLLGLINQLVIIWRQLSPDRRHRLEAALKRQLNSAVTPAFGDDQGGAPPAAPEDVLERLRLELDAHSDRELAQALGVAPSTLSSWRQREVVPYATCVAVALERGVCRDWLILGKEREVIEEDAAALTIHRMGTLLMMVEAKLVDPAKLGSVFSDQHSQMIAMLDRFAATDKERAQLVRRVIRGDRKGKLDLRNADLLGLVKLLPPEETETEESS